MVTMLAKTPEYKKNTKVRATRDLPGVPEGTPGKVKLVNGTTWLRYWVMFDNGEWLGTIDHADIVPASDWDQYLIDRENAANAPEAAAVSAEGDGGGEAATDGGGYLHNGTMVPQHLVERTKAARQRFGLS